MSDLISGLCVESKPNESRFVSKALPLCELERILFDNSPPPSPKQHDLECESMVPSGIASEEKLPEDHHFLRTIMSDDQPTNVNKIICKLSSEKKPVPSGGHISIFKGSVLDMQFFLVYLMKIKEDPFTKPYITLNEVRSRIYLQRKCPVDFYVAYLRDHGFLLSISDSSLDQADIKILLYQKGPMKIAELFTYLRTHEIEKKVSDPIKNVVSAYQKLFDNDEVIDMLTRYAEVHEKFKNNFDNNQFTLRNYLTAYRDLCRMSVIKDDFLRVQSATQGHHQADDDWEILMGMIERDRAEHVKAANALQRLKKKEKSITTDDVSLQAESHQDQQDIEHVSVLLSLKGKVSTNSLSDSSPTDDSSHNHPEHVDKEKLTDLISSLRHTESKLIDSQRHWIIAMQNIFSALSI